MQIVLNGQQVQTEVRTLRELIVEKGIAPELVNRLKVNAEKCEFIRFAPSSNGNVEMQNMYKSLSDIVIEIERSLN